MAVLRGAVLYGLDPSVVHVRRAMKTYGIGVIKPYLREEHPPGMYCTIKFKGAREKCMVPFALKILYF